jgi:hypothetical protein
MAMEAPPRSRRRRIVGIAQEAGGPFWKNTPEQQKRTTKNNTKDIKKYVFWENTTLFSLSLHAIRTIYASHVLAFRKILPTMTYMQ